MAKVDAEIVIGDELWAELKDWLAANWDPDLSVADWWERLGTAGWSAPTLPIGAYGRGISRADAVRVATEIARFGALGAPAGLGLLLAAPTIAAHGTQAQIDTFVRDIVTGRKSWCQLFSEPGAGSDLAGLTTRAVLDGDEWVVNGQKVWTSFAHVASLGILLARTDPDVPKHQGISYFVCPMDAPGVTIRPIVDMTGDHAFNEVFLDEVRLPAQNLVGELNAGWALAKVTLGNERVSLSGEGALWGQGPTVGDLLDIVRRAGGVRDAALRQALAKVWIEGEILRLIR